MTLKDLHERIGWQLEGRLQTRYENNWVDVKHTAPPHVCDPPEVYRRRPDPAAMPDEVWLSESPDQGHLPPWKGPKPDTLYGANAVRYVRAGVVIPAKQMQFRQRIRNWEWSDCIETNEYRIKP